MLTLRAPVERQIPQGRQITLPFGFTLQKRARRVVERVHVLSDGMVERFIPAQKNKEATPMGRIIRAFSTKWERVEGEPSGRFTTEQGSAQFAEPLMAQAQLIQLRYDRRAIIAECRQMIYDCPRARKSTRMYALEAVRRGVKITPTKEATRGTTAGLYKKADAIAKKVESIVNPLLFSWAWMLIVEGDLFLQLISDGHSLLDITRMPADGIERNSDDQDKFPDPYHAFSQVGVASNIDYATWPEFWMLHARWEHVDGERYGNPCIVAGRRLRRLLELSEDHQVLRRMTHSNQQILWIIGSKDRPGLAGSDSEIKHFREMNGFESGLRDPLNPMNAVIDRFGNGNVDAKVLEGDPNIADIADLEYLASVYGMALPTPYSLMNFLAQDINRDILTEQYRQWLNDTQLLTDYFEFIVADIYDRALLLEGILPDAIAYTCSIAHSDAETRTEKTERLLKMYQNTLGIGQSAIAAPLLSRSQILTQLQEDFPGDIEDMLRETDVESARLADEEMQRQEEQMKAVAANSPNPMNSEPNNKNGNSSRNGNSHATNGKSLAGAAR
jgi:hypothetical protein